MPFKKRYSTLEDVLANTRKQDECLNWSGAYHRTGYPACSNYGLFKSQALHREVFRLANGYYPQVVMHLCDNPKCINPKHLFGGTPLENMRDMDAKNRRATGARNGNAKLSDEDVELIRMLKSKGATYKSLCARFNVSRGYVWKLIAQQYRSLNGDRRQQATAV